MKGEKMELKGSKTEKNIMGAFAGESQARNRYTFFASAAKKDGFIQVASVFEETANQEKEHAKILFGLLKGGEVEITAAFPAGVVGTTVENLKASAGGEDEESKEGGMYPTFVKIALEEGFDKIAKIFESIAVVERQHKKRFLGLAEAIETGKMFKREKSVKWRCTNCGYIHEGEEAPKVCPACMHPQGYYELLYENW
jgi:rubrerythrin